MIAVTITAFGYEHEFVDDYTAEDIDIIENAPVRYIVSGPDEKIESFASILDSDWTVLVSEAGEYIFFGYEILPFSIVKLLPVLGLAFEMEDAEDEEAA